MKPLLTSTLLVAVLLISVATMARMNPPPPASVTAQIDCNTKTPGWLEEHQTIFVENKGELRDHNGQPNTQEGAHTDIIDNTISWYKKHQPQ